MSFTQLFVSVVIVGALMALARRFRGLGQRQKDYPPGPPTLPIIGNILQMPKEKGHLQFEKWGEEYGPMYSLILGGQTVIVISSEHAMRDLLEKRGAVYSSRPDSYLSHDVLSGGLRVVFMKYDKSLKLARKLAKGVLSDNMVRSTFLAYQDLESRAMLVGFLERPDQFISHLKRFTTSFATQMVFGHRTPSEDDLFMKKLFHHLENFSLLSGTHTANLLNIFPILRRLPDFLLPTRRRAKKLHLEELKLFVEKYTAVKSQVRRGIAMPCASAMFAEAQEKENVPDDLMAYFSGSLLQAGSETTMATLLGFVQAMVIFPDVSKAAQAEIDSVCGDRLPSVEDWKDLAYIRGCIKESLRWMPTTILGVPHSVEVEDQYMGYRIPKNATIIYNVWAIHNDPSRYPNPRDFDPTRWANDNQSSYESARNEDVTQRDHYSFGMGRRMCLAMNLVDQFMFLAIARLLWAFDFNRAVDGKTMQEIIPNMEDLSNGLFTMPNPFAADIKPRGGKRAEQIREAWQRAKTELLDQDLQWKEIPVSPFKD